MRHSFSTYIQAIIALLFVTSCQSGKEESIGEIAVKIRMEMKEYGVLSFVTESHIWMPEDQVFLAEVANGATAYASPLSSGGGRAMAICSLALPSDDNTIVGLYPHESDVEIKDGKLHYEIPQIQNGELMSLQGGKTTIRRKSYETFNLSLAPLYKVLNVRVDRRNSIIKSVTVKAADGSMISGKTTIETDSWKQNPISASVTYTPGTPVDCTLAGISFPVMVADNGVQEYIAEVTDMSGNTFLADKVTEGLYYNEKTYELGISQALFGSLSKAEAASMPSAGVKYIEVTMNDFWRGYTLEECYKRARNTKQIIENTQGLEVWSVHLPFSKTLDISVTDENARAENVATMKEMIRLAGEFGPKKLVLHPSSEPIAEQDRAERLKCSKKSIGELITVAKEIGAQLCIENLPRTCLGRTSSDMMYLIEDYPEVMVCFDSNHLLIEDHNSFFRNVGERIGTIHASDYDKTDEKHWMPGLGIINWPMFLTNLMHYDYEGVFMTEIKGDYTAAEVVYNYKNVICATK